MGRKRGKNSDTSIKDQERLDKLLESVPPKTHSEVAKELGIDQSTVSRSIKRVLNNARIQEVIQRSIDRNAMMLGKADYGLNEILDDRDPIRQPVRLKAIEGLYKTFGVWKQEPIIQVNNFTPIVIKTHEGIESIDVGATSEAESGLQKSE